MNFDVSVIALLHLVLGGINMGFIRGRVILVMDLPGDSFLGPGIGA